MQLMIKLTETEKKALYTAGACIVFFAPIFTGFFIGLYFLNNYIGEHTTPNNIKITNILNNSTRFSGDTQLDTQARIDLLVKNHAISIDKQAEILQLQKTSDLPIYIILTPFFGMFIGFVSAILLQKLLFE